MFKCDNSITAKLLNGPNEHCLFFQRKNWDHWTPRSNSIKNSIQALNSTIFILTAKCMELRYHSVMSIKGHLRATLTVRTREHNPQCQVLIDLHSHTMHAVRIWKQKWNSNLKRTDQQLNTLKQCNYTFTFASFVQLHQKLSPRL